MIPSSSIGFHGEAHHVRGDTTNNADHKAEPGLRKSQICKRDEIKGTESFMFEQLTHTNPEANLYVSFKLYEPVNILCHFN